MSTDVLTHEDVVVSKDGKKRGRPKDDELNCVADSDNETRSDEESDAGSLVDFIVDDEEGGDTAPPDTSPGTNRDLEDITTNNIISGKRTRKQTKFYEQEVFSSTEYQDMVLADVPDDEMDAVFSEEEQSSTQEDESDCEYTSEKDQEEDEADSCDEDATTSVEEFSEDDCSDEETLVNDEEKRKQQKNKEKKNEKN